MGADAPTFGQELAWHIAGMRAVYGRYPVPEGTARPGGFEDFPIRAAPTFDGMTSIQKNMVAMNRADYRQRLRHILEPRDMRLATYTRLRRKNKPWKSDEAKK